MQHYNVQFILINRFRILQEFCEIWFEISDIEALSIKAIKKNVHAYKLYQI